MARFKKNAEISQADSGRKKPTLTHKTAYCDIADAIGNQHNGFRSFSAGLLQA
jgi:hypothetical protein